MKRRMMLGFMILYFTGMILSGCASEGYVYASPPPYYVERVRIGSPHYKINRYHRPNYVVVKPGKHRY